MTSPWVQVDKRFTRANSGKTCAHCGDPQVGYAMAGGQPLCHADFGLDCYRLVTVFKHPTPCDCTKGSEHPDRDECDRCHYRRFEHRVDPAEPAQRRTDFLGNPVPCFNFQMKAMPLPF